MKAHVSAIFVLYFILSANQILAQSQPYQGPDDPAGDPAAVREGYMSGNDVLLYFQNTTELAKWTSSYRDSKWSRWPNSIDGVRMLDGMALLAGARIYIRNDSIPVTDPMEIENFGSLGELDTLYYLQTSYRERMDLDPTGTVEWGFYPVFGYFNENNQYPAMSNLPASWPPSGWPAPGNTTKWPGEWNGRFGRGVKYADLESYFVANDAQDQEYLGPEDSIKYYPRPGVYIGDKRPEVTIQKGLPWGGIGLRVEMRGFQWRKEEARDILFWEYKFANISDYDIPDFAIGFWVDNGIGGESDDELGFYDTSLDLFYSWDTDGIGAGGLPTGTMGFAFLETPGISDDGIDNDNDGLTDEKRFNQAGNLVGPYEGISDLNKFLKYYNLKEKHLRWHFEGDEDQDWLNGYDKNGNGTYAYQDTATKRWLIEAGEFAGDDIGLDGIGPGDLNYNGPDQGEGNQRPDFVEGMGCEPNFASTDIGEGDMLGLTSSRLFPIPAHRPPYTNWFQNDKSMWDIIGEQKILNYAGNISNLVMTFSSGPFALLKGMQKGISIAELHAYDELSGLNSDVHSSPSLFNLKVTAQNIYENDFRFNIKTKNSLKIATGQTGMLDDTRFSGTSASLTAGSDTVNLTIFSYNGNPDSTLRTERSFIRGVGNYIKVLADGDIVWPADLKIYYTQKALESSGVDESELKGIYYWSDSEADWRLYSNSGAEDQNRGISTTGINTENINIGGYEYEGYVWASAYHLTSMRMGTEVDSVLSYVQTGNSKPPANFNLSQNYPNPFNPLTTIEFNLPQSKHTTLKIYNILGAEVATLVSDKLSAGMHKYTFDGSNLASGVYYYQVTAGDFREVKKMILLR